MCYGVDVFGVGILGVDAFGVDMFGVDVLGVDVFGVAVLWGGCATAWLAAWGGCYSLGWGMWAGGVAEAVGIARVVALGAGLLEWVWGCVYGGWRCVMGVFQGPWVQGGLLQCPVVAWGVWGAGL